MATLAVTIPINQNAGSLLRRAAMQLEKLAGDLPDNNSTGASYVLTIDNAPSAGVMSLQITAGPVSPSAVMSV